MSVIAVGQFRNPNAVGVSGVLCRHDVRRGIPFVWYLPESGEPSIRGTFQSEPSYTEDGYLVEVRVEGSDHDSELCLRDMGITSHANGSWSRRVTILDIE